MDSLPDKYHDYQRVLEQCQQQHEEMQQKLQEIKARVAEQRAQPPPLPGRIGAWLYRRFERGFERQEQEIADMEASLAKLEATMQALGLELSYPPLPPRPPRVRVISVPVEGVILAVVAWLAACIWFLLRAGH